MVPAGTFGAPPVGGASTASRAFCLFGGFCFCFCPRRVAGRGGFCPAFGVGGGGAPTASRNRRAARRASSLAMLSRSSRSLALAALMSSLKPAANSCASRSNRSDFFANAARLARSSAFSARSCARRAARSRSRTAERNLVWFTQYAADMRSFGSLDPAVAPWGGTQAAELSVQGKGSMPCCVSSRERVELRCAERRLSRLGCLLRRKSGARLHALDG